MAMARGAAAAEPKEWIAGDETAAAALSRALAAGVRVTLPPPLHRAVLRPGNVVEIAGASGSGKSHLLFEVVLQCILPKEWRGMHVGGIGKAVAYIDLDCRFDMLRFSELLRNRITLALGLHHQIRAYGNEGLHLSNADGLFNFCMKHFLYIRCYSSSELLSSLKTIYSQSEARSQDLGCRIHFLMLDGIGAFYWTDRACVPIGENRRNLSPQSITESVVEELRKLLQLQPLLIFAAKTTWHVANDSQRSFWNSSLEATSTSRYEQGKRSSFEFMPPVWQSFVTHRIQLQSTGGSSEEDSVVYICEWVQPSLHKDNFCIGEDGIYLIH